MIRHLVLFRFRPELSAVQVDEAVAAFRALQWAIDAVKAFEDGTNVSPEGLTQGYTHAFLLGFDTADARDAYLDHPAHKAFVAYIQPLLQEALVFDWKRA
ncbi:Dabb family protein [Niveibacterium sp.]|uniref:Dabb family protein n=1 Tax=Niveibacterium sp. TaxID=2017444 RepID=UPI0035B00D1D